MSRPARQGEREGTLKGGIESPSIQPFHRSRRKRSIISQCTSAAVWPLQRAQPSTAMRPRKQGPTHRPRRPLTRFCSVSSSSLAMCTFAVRRHLRFSPPRQAPHVSTACAER
ncbi:hypothetical protein SEVIR_3G121450v4 [Setaria viridis]